MPGSNWWPFVTGQWGHLGHRWMIWRAAPISVENSTGKSWDSRWTMVLEQCASRGTSFMLRFTWMRLWKFSLCHVNEPVNCDAWVQMIDIFWAQIICLLFENGVLVSFGPCKAIGCKGDSTMKLASWWQWTLHLACHAIQVNELSGCKNALQPLPIKFQEELHQHSPHPTNLLLQLLQLEKQSLFGLFLRCQELKSKNANDCNIRADERKGFRVRGCNSPY